jgi:glutaryl-CoA dehydrogenase
MKEQVQPIINEFWLLGRFPSQLLPEMKKLDIFGLKDSLLTGLITMEIGRVDPSMATFYTIQNCLVIQCIAMLGTEKQKDKWLWPLINLEKIGCFAMTEPLSGSDASKGFKTTAEQEEGFGYYFLTGQKKWIGNAPFADISIVWTKDKDNEIKGFIVETREQDFIVETITDKFGLRPVQNGIIRMNNVMVSAENRLRGSFKDILLKSRYYVGWEATGLQLGAYEHALKYAKERKQFGKPIASFQLIQDLLVKMLSNVVASQCMMLQLGKLENMTMQQAALAKAFTTSKARETVSMAREIFGANGMSLEYNIGRFFTDAEALYTYEGSYQMNELIVGKAITGESAFV